MSIDRNPAILIDIANACDLISDFVRGRCRDDLDSDLLFQCAVLHQLLILGEAIRQPSSEFRASHPEIDWSGYIGQRNVLIHRYPEVDLDRVWQAANNEVPELRQWIEPWLPQEFVDDKSQ